MTRVIALRHGTLPLFDATKCRLCLRRLLRGFFLVIRETSPEMQEQSRAKAGIELQTHFLFSSCRSYLIFVIFFTRAKFLENKIYTEKACKLRQNTQKIANFLRYYGKIHSKLPIFSR